MERVFTKMKKENMILDKIKYLADIRKYGEALRECETILLHSPEYRENILRIRAYVLAKSGDYEKALLDRKEILCGSSAKIKDYYLASTNALSSGHFDEAVEWLNIVLVMGKEQNDTWFEEVSHLFLSYALLQLGRYADAHQSLACLIESDCAMPVPRLGMLTVDNVRREIQEKLRLNRNSEDTTLN